MFALVESGSITKILHGNKGINIGDNQYPASIFTLWPESEKNAIGIYTVEIDRSNYKDIEWYINTNQTITYDASSNKVKATYGTATARAHADTKWTQKEIDDGDAPEGADTNTIKDEGLKTVLIRNIKKQAESILNQTDWYVVRKADTDEAVPSSIATHRAAVRTKQASMCTAITNAADTAALKTLYTYTTTDGVTSRPLGAIPTLD